MKNKKYSFKRQLLRVFVWSVVTVIIFTTAHYLRKHTERESHPEQSLQLKRSLEAFWELQKARTFQINKAAEEYIIANNLKPGDPLPPNTFYQENDPLRKNLRKREALQITNTLELQAHPLKITCAALTTVTNKVPKPPERYAYCGILWSKSLTGSSYEIYPNDNFAMRRMLEANKEVEQKRNLQNKTNSSPQ